MTRSDFSDRAKQSPKDQERMGCIIYMMYDSVQ